MFQPQFSLTLRIVNELSKIERLYGKIASEKLIPSLALQLATENQILATHYSTSIEGNPLTTLDVTNIILGDQIATTKPDREVKNYFAVLTKLFDLERRRVPISTELTRELHKELMEGLETKDLGEFRSSGVFVGHREHEQLVVKHNPPFHTREEIENALNERFAWLMEEDDLHPMIKAGIFHHQFVYVHPFLDGNGRLARLLTAYYLLLKQYEVARYFILDDYYDVDRHLYSDSLHSADSGDETSWLEYLLEGIAYSLQAASGRIEIMRKAGIEEVMGEKRVLVTPREEQVLEIVINKKAIKTPDIEAALSVTRQQAHALLSSLVEKNILQKHGKTKMSYYTLVKKITS
ncbi:MAG: Fic family protein [Candidatus Levybacteria bacterium]|nr:Fic family protein [Candidatus Levybacteria bacterium]